MISRLGLKNTPFVSLLRVKTLPNDSPRYDTKSSDGDTPVPNFIAITPRSTQT